MAEDIRAVTWEAPEHHHIEKTADWYWALGIIAVAGAGASIVFHNTLFALVILFGATAMIVVAHRGPRMIEFGVSTRGVKVADEFYPYTLLESFYIDEEEPLGPQLLVKTTKTFTPLIILPLPEEEIHTIDDIIASRLPEEHLEEPFSHKLLEFLGF